jgi:hypothetical protein
VDDSSDTSNIIGMLFTNLEIGNARLAKYSSYLSFQFENLEAFDKAELEAALISTSPLSDEKIEFLKSVNYQAIFAESLITAVNNSIENSCTEIIKAHLRLFDKKKDTITIPLSEFEKHDLETIRNKYHGRYIDHKLLNLNFYDKIKYLIDDIGFIELNKESVKQSLLQLRDLRNLISHNNSKINESFYSNYGPKFGDINETISLSLNRTYSIFYLGAKIQVILEVFSLIEFNGADSENLATDIIVKINDILLGNYEENYISRDKCLWSNFNPDINLKLYLELLEMIISICKDKHPSIINLFETIQLFSKIALAVENEDDFSVIKKLISSKLFVDFVKEVFPNNHNEIIFAENTNNVMRWFKSKNTILNLFDSQKSNDYFRVNMAFTIFHFIWYFTSNNEN